MSMPFGLATMGVGSWASPGWFVAARERIRDGSFGPQDVEETLDDVTRLALLDQIEAGFDILSDGEMRRQRFVYEMYDRLAGLRRLPSSRRLGVPGYDMAPRFEAAERLTAPTGLGLVDDFRRCLRLLETVPGFAGRPLKVALPGPLTFANTIRPEPGYGAGEAGTEALFGDLIGIVHGELLALAAAGAVHLQLDEPSLARLPLDLSLDRAVEMINRTLDRVPGHLAVHVCFGNNAGRPNAERSLARLLPAMRTLRCRQLVLEFANRQMAEVELLRDLGRTHDIAAGVVDVKSFHEETGDEVANRARAVLRYVPADRLTLTADCGFSACPRWLARSKAQALVAGARLLRPR